MFSAVLKLHKAEENSKVCNFTRMTKAHFTALGKFKKLPVKIYLKNQLPRII
jgi:hypothetical protein